MERNNSDNPDLYIVAYVNEEGEVTGFPMGGGSSTKPSVKAHKKYSSAKRSSRHFPSSKVVKPILFEVADEE